MERALGDIELSEQCIKALEKIAEQNPYPVLQSGALGMILNMMDFFV